MGAADSNIAPEWVLGVSCTFPSKCQFPMPYKAHDIVLSIPEYATKWQNSKLTERSAAQSHFIDLCNVLDYPAPTEIDQEGTTFTFEKGVATNTGGDGFADVWKRKFFAWEYKRKHGSLPKAYQQLLKYREALENPPLLVVCDMNLFEVHTNWTNTPPEIYSFSLQELVINHPTSACKLPPLEVLRALFHDPVRLKPGQTTADVTAEAAKEFAKLAESLHTRGIVGEAAAHFIMRLLFCLFAEDIGLLPNDLFTRLIQANRNRPVEFTKKLRQLFSAMSQESGTFGPEDVPYFDGGLFMNDDAYELTTDDLSILARAAALNWAGIEPAIFGTLFERILDPDKRSQIGAHYTSKEDITLIVEPVLMEPLRRKWAKVRRQAVELLTKADEKSRATSVQRKLGKALSSFADEVASIRVLDPACGSGNFLYVSLKLLLDLEKQISVFASSNGLSRFFVRCRPDQLYGIESNIYAHKIASVAVWIGFLQWQRDNGIIITDNPIMQPLENIHRMDALLGRDRDGNVSEPSWPSADVIVGNPPFLGDKRMRSELGDPYVEDLRKLYSNRVPGGADFVTYWFEKARHQIESRNAKRAGLLGTNSIRTGANQKVLQRIKASGDIFMAWSDRPWVLDGAAVRVSMVGFDDGSESHKMLDGCNVKHITGDLKADLDTASLKALEENEGLCFLGMMKGGPFDLTPEQAKPMLVAPVNPNGKRNSNVVKRRLIGRDILGKSQDGWVIDFRDMAEAAACLYELPFEYVKKHVKPVRMTNRDAQMKRNWWLHGRSRPALRKALAGLKRCIVTSEVAKHRVFVWMDAEIVPDHRLHVITRSDDYFMGVLQSRADQIWAVRVGSTLEDRPCYNSDSIFLTFPFPWSPRQEPESANEAKSAIAQASRTLVGQRDAWLAAETGRTLTGLYNLNPSWLQKSHEMLDRAVFSAYEWSLGLSDTEILGKLMELNASRYQEQGRTAATAAHKSVGRKTPKPAPVPAETKRISGRS